VPAFRSHAVGKKQGRQERIGCRLWWSYLNDKCSLLSRFPDDPISRSPDVS
jgi:hypothetical protein